MIGRFPAKFNASLCSSHLNKSQSVPKKPKKKKIPLNTTKFRVMEPRDIKRLKTHALKIEHGIAVLCFSREKNTQLNLACS